MPKQPKATSSELTPYIHHQGGTQTIAFMVGGVHCAGCIAKLEGTLKNTPGVTAARLNFTTKRLQLTYGGNDETPAHTAIQRAEAAGYTLQPYNPEALGTEESKHEKFLLRCLAVAGFANMNVMLFSVSLWSGAWNDPATRMLMEWISAAITLPAIAYAGQPYFQAAWKALSHGRTSMEVPISLALLLTTGLSLYDTIVHRGETYFESAAMLLFFLLTGRYLEARVKGHSRGNAEHLLSFQSAMAVRVGPKGQTHTVPASALRVGDTVLWRTGDRLPVDGTLAQGPTTVDTSILTGESLPRTVQQAEAVQAGTVNCGPAVKVTVTATGQGTVLAEIARLVDNATTVKNAYTRLADRVARYYAPVVHSLALITFVLCLMNGLDTHSSILRAAAVLLVTCPCALALAVPTVQVAVIGNLLKQGVILKSGEALEKLATITSVVLDKTGTLTTGQFQLVRGGSASIRTLAASLAANSNHPLAQALTRAAPCPSPLPHVREIPGQGLETTHKGQKIRLGSAAFCGVRTLPPLNPGESALFLKKGTSPAIHFILKDTLRPHAQKAVQTLESQGIKVTLLSGDASPTVQALAAEVGITTAVATATPQEKQKQLKALAASGQQVMMVGDGINDAPSLALAPVGVSFGKATNLAQLNADIILQQEDLLVLPRLLQTAKTAKFATSMNFGLSFAYNIATIPLAMLGFISPLWAAVAMSASSLTVVGSSLLLTRQKA